jgi:hypothetical protein
MRRALSISAGAHQPPFILSVLEATRWWLSRVSLTVRARQDGIFGVTRRSARCVTARIEIGDTRHRNQVIAPEVATFAFNATFLMTLAGRAELRGKPPVLARLRGFAGFSVRHPLRINGLAGKVCTTTDGE